MIKTAVGLGATAFALPMVAEMTPETWIGLLAKAGLQAVLSIVIVALTLALIWMTKKAMSRNEKAEGLAEKVAAAMQSQSDSQERHTASLDRFATVIEKCEKVK